MEDIKDHHAGDHHRAIQGNKEALGGDQIPTPPLGQLDCAVDTSHIDTQHGEDHGGEERDDRAVHRLEEPVAEDATDKVGCAGHEDGDRRHLEDDAGDHDVGSGGGVAVHLAGLGGGHAAADRLDDERDHVAGAEDPEVQAWAEDGGLATEDLDEAAEEDVNAGGKEDGGWTGSRG